MSTPRRLGNRSIEAVRFWAIAFAIALASFTFFAQRASAATIAFEAPVTIIQPGLNGTPGAFSLPTSLTTDPETGRLYVATQCGLIHIFDLGANNTPAFRKTLTNVNAYPNFQFDGTTPKPNLSDFVCGDGSGDEDARQTTGIAFDPDPPAGKTVLYVSHSDPDIFTNKAPQDSNISPSAGVLSKFVLGGPNKDQVESFSDLVVGLPRSAENHAPNGLDFGPDGWLYLSIGGSTNFGGKSEFFSWYPETHHSGAVVRIQPDAITPGNPVDVTPYNRFTFTTVGTPPETTYTKTAGSTATANVPGVFELYATGFRNGYDIAWHSNGNLYLNENHGNDGFGGTPGSSTKDNVCPGAGGANPGTPPDQLHLVSQGKYHGHPNPARLECNYEQNSGGVFNTYNPEIHEYTPLNGQTRRSLVGIAEYESAIAPFGGDLQGQLIVASQSVTQGIWREKLNAAGNDVVEEELIAEIGGALDVAVAADGSLLVASVFDAGAGHAGKVFILRPDSDVGPCPLPGNPAVNDSDNDGYTDADELTHSTNLCSKASSPPDADGDSIGDLTDPDDDNDGTPDTQDQLQLDPANGANTALPFTLAFNTTTGGGFFNTGFPGIQISSKAVGGGPLAGKVGGGAAGGFLQMVTTAGTNRGSANNQNNALQVGVPVNQRFDATVAVRQPFLTDLSDEDGKPEGGESSGLYFGPDEDNFVQVGVNANNGNPIIELVAETAGGTNAVASAPLALPLDGVDLRLRANPADGLVEAFYTLPGGAEQALGTTTVPTSWFSPPIIGLAGTSTGSAEQQSFVFDNFSVAGLPSTGTPGGGPGTKPPGDDPKDGPKTAKDAGVKLTVAQLRINQRISAAAIRRADAVQRWLDAGLIARDLRGGSIAEVDLAADVTTGPGPAQITATANPRTVSVSKPSAKTRGRITVSVRQLRINQKISSAAVRRTNALKTRLRALTGGDFRARGQVGTGQLAPGLRIIDRGATATPPASTTPVSVAGKSSGKIRLTAGQLLINQRISQAAVRRSNSLIGVLGAGLGGEHFVDGSIAAAQLAGG